MKNSHATWFINFLLCLFVFITSCTSTKRITYFRDIPDSVNHTYPVALTNYKDVTIRVKDNLFINLQTIEQNSSNTPINSITAQFNPLNGYLVDNDGYIEISLVGKVKVLGLTTTEAGALIKDKASKFYKDPVVNVRIANFEVAVLGEVGRPGLYPITNERAGILEALTLGGDITIYGKRENVTLVREENGEKKFIKFDLRTTDMFSSPYYYLKQGDVVYVEPNRAKIVNSDGRILRTLGIITSVISLSSIIYAVTRK